MTIFGNIVDKLAPNQLLINMNILASTITASASQISTVKKNTGTADAPIINYSKYIGTN